MARSFSLTDSICTNNPRISLSDKEIKRNNISNINRKELEENYLRLYQENFGLKKKCVDLENHLYNLTNRMIQISNDIDKPYPQSNRCPEIEALIRWHESKINDCEKEIRILNKKCKNLESNLEECIKQNPPKQTSQIIKRQKPMKKHGKNVGLPQATKNIIREKEHELSRLEKQLEKTRLNTMERIKQLEESIKVKEEINQIDYMTKQNVEVIRLRREGINIQNELKAAQDRCEYLQKEMDSIKNVLTRQNSNGLFQKPSHIHELRSSFENNTTTSYRNSCQRFRNYEDNPNIYDNNQHYGRKNKLFKSSCSTCRYFEKQRPQFSKVVQILEPQSDNNLQEEELFKNYNNKNTKKHFKNVRNSIYLYTKILNSTTPEKELSDNKNESFIELNKLNKSENHVQFVDKSVMVNMGKSRKKNKSDKKMEPTNKITSFEKNRLNNNLKIKKFEYIVIGDSKNETGNLKGIMNPSLNSTNNFVRNLGFHEYNKVHLPTFQEYIAQMNMFMVLLNKEEEKQVVPIIRELKPPSFETPPEKINPTYQEEQKPNNFTDPKSKPFTEPKQKMFQEPKSTIYSESKPEILKEPKSIFLKGPFTQPLPPIYSGTKSLNDTLLDKELAEEVLASHLEGNDSKDLQGSQSLRKITYEQRLFDSRDQSLPEENVPIINYTKGVTINSEKNDSLNTSSEFKDRRDSVESRIWDLRPIKSNSARKNMSSYAPPTVDHSKNKNVNSNKTNSVFLKYSKKLSSLDDLADLIPALNDLDKIKQEEIAAKNKEKFDETQKNKNNQLNGKQYPINQRNTFQDFPITEYPSSSLTDMSELPSNEEEEENEKKSTKCLSMDYPELDDYACKIVLPKENVISAQKELFENHKLMTPNISKSEEFSPELYPDEITIKVLDCKLCHQFVDKLNTDNNVFIEYSFLGCQDYNLESESFKLKSKFPHHSIYNYTINFKRVFYVSPKINPYRRNQLAKALQNADDHRDKIIFYLKQENPDEEEDECTEIAWAVLNLQEVIKVKPNKKTFYLNLYSNNHQIVGSISVSIQGIITLRAISRDIIIQSF